MSAFAGPPSLGSLNRKAAVDAGFDLEPDIDAGWWRLRASGAPGVVWVRPLVDGNGTLLALPLAPQLSELYLPVAPVGPPHEEYPAPPTGAAGVARCPSPHALHAALRRVWTLRANAPERLRVQWEVDVAAVLAHLGVSPAATSTPATTELVAEIRRRVGQDRFRGALLDYWDGQCAVSGLAVPELLRASHAKPWAVATDTERLDVHNGLLLAVHLDALFDRGFITFHEDGRGVLSTNLPRDARGVLGLSDGGFGLRRMHQAHQPYLTYHRTSVFRT